MPRLKWAPIDTNFRVQDSQLDGEVAENLILRSKKVRSTLWLSEDARDGGSGDGIQTRRAVIISSTRTVGLQSKMQSAS